MYISFFHLLNHHMELESDQVTFFFKNMLPDFKTITHTL